MLFNDVFSKSRSSKPAASGVLEKHLLHHSLSHLRHRPLQASKACKLRISDTCKALLSGWPWVL